MHNGTSHLCKAPVQLVVHFYFFLLYFLTCGLDWHAYVNCSVILALLWLYVLMKTLPPVRQDLWNLQIFFLDNKTRAWIQLANVHICYMRLSSNVIHSTSMYGTLLRLPALCLSVNTTVNETDVHRPCMCGGYHPLAEAAEQISNYPLC